MTGYLVIGIYYLLYCFLGLIGINIIISWFPPLANLRFFQFLKRITDTYMKPFHGYLVLGMFDFTPIIGIALFEFIIQIYVYLLS